MARNPTWRGAGSNVYINYVDDGYNVKVSTDDTTPDFLDQKIVAGTDITISTLNPAGDEQLQISVSAGAAGFDGYTVKATVTDTTPDFIDQKLIPVGLMTITQQNAGADEYLEIGVDQDGYLTYTEIDGYAQKTLLDAYASKTLVDGYLTYTEIDGYATKALVDGYLTYTEIDGYALASYVDSQDATKLDKTTADAYLTYLEIDGYALTSYVDSQDDLKLDKTTADAYLTYLEIDGYALKTYVDSQDATKADLTLLDGYLGLNGSDAMAGNLDMGTNDITNVGNVDGYDLPAQFQSITNDDAYQDAQLTG
jgi:hypothetical protein